MTNKAAGRRESFWDSIEDLAFYAAAMTLIMHVVDIVDRSDDWAGWTVTFWGGLYLFAAPFMVWRVATREPPGDRWRAAALMAYGVLPIVAFIPPETPFLERPISTFAIPAMVAWGVTAEFLALRSKPRPQSARARAVMMAGAGVISGLVALPLFAGAGIGIAYGVWEPPPSAIFLTPIIVLVCLPLALATGYASLKLFSEAARALRSPTAAAP